MAAVIYDRLCIFEFGIVTEFFGLSRPELGIPWYRFIVAAAEPGPLRTTGGITFHPDRDLSVLSEAGTIVLPGWRDPSEKPPEGLLTSLRQAHDRGARILSICTGAFALAPTGLLDGKRATTHWRFADRLADAYPNIYVDADVLYVDEGNIITSAGSAAGIDACLHLVRRDYGSDVANQVARRMVVQPQRDGGQAQYIPQPIPRTDDQSLADVMDFAIANLHQPLTVDDLADKALLATRTFTRRFRLQTGTSPHRWLIQQRLAAAQRLLETTPLSIEAIAQATGLNNAANLRHHFRSAYNTTPTAYRNHFSRRTEPGAAAPR